MTPHKIERCLGCETALPENRHHSTKYCSPQCRKREKVRRYRARKAPREKTPTEKLAELKIQHDQLSRENQDWRRRVSERDSKIRRLEYALDGSEQQVDRVAMEQASRTHDVRQQLAAANSQVATLRRNWSVRADAEVAGETVTKLRTQLATVTGHYNELVDKYKELTAAAKSAANERKHVQGIVRQWDALCVRLNKATGGQPRKESDKKILATWTRFRKIVRK